MKRPALPFIILFGAVSLFGCQRNPVDRLLGLDDHSDNKYSQPLIAAAKGPVPAPSPTPSASVSPSASPSASPAASAPKPVASQPPADSLAPARRARLYTGGLNGTFDDGFGNKTPMNVAPIKIIVHGTSAKLYGTIIEWNKTMSGEGAVDANNLPTENLVITFSILVIRGPASPQEYVTVEPDGTTTTELITPNRGRRHEKKDASFTLTRDETDKDGTTSHTVSTITNGPSPLVFSGKLVMIGTNARLDLSCADGSKASLTGQLGKNRD